MYGTEAKEWSGERLAPPGRRRVHTLATPGRVFGRPAERAKRAELAPCEGNVLLVYPDLTDSFETFI